MTILENPCLYMTIFGLTVKVWATRKLYILQSNKPLTISMVFFGLFLIACYSLTIVEFSIYISLGHAVNPMINFIMTSYYISALAALAIVPLAIASLIYKNVSKTIMAISAIIFTVFAYLIIGTDYIIQGYHMLKFYYTRTPGPYYISFQAYTAITLVGCLIMLIRETMKSESSLKQAKVNNILIGFLPLAIMIVFIMDLMRVGFEISIIGFTILLSSFFIIIIANNFSTNIVDLRIYLPWTRKARMIRQISKPFWNIDPSEGIYKHSPKEFEQKLIEFANEMFISRKEAAKWLGISESKLYRALSAKDKETEVETETETETETESETDSN